MPIVSIGSAGYYFVDGERISVVRARNEVPKEKISVKANAMKTRFEFYPARDKSASTHRERMLDIGKLFAIIREEQDTKVKFGSVKFHENGENYVVEIEDGKPTLDDYKTGIAKLQHWDDPAAEDAAKADDKKKADAAKKADDSKKKADAAKKADDSKKKTDAAKKADDKKTDAAKKADDKKKADDSKKTATALPAKPEIITPEQKKLDTASIISDIHSGKMDPAAFEKMLSGNVTVFAGSSDD